MMLKTALFCLKKLRLRHFCRKCRENLNIRVLRTKFWVKSACEDAPQVVPAWCTVDWIDLHWIAFNCTAGFQIHGGSGLLLAGRIVDLIALTLDCIYTGLHQFALTLNCTAGFWIHGWSGLLAVLSGGGAAAVRQWKLLSAASPVRRATSLRRHNG